MRLLPLTLLLAAIVVPPNPVSGFPAGDGENPLFFIDGKPVGASDLRAYVDALHPGEVAKGKAPPAHLVEGFLNNRLLAERAVAEGLDRLPEVRSRLESVLNGLWVEPYWEEVVRPGVRVDEADLLAQIPPMEETVTFRLLLVPDRKTAEELRAETASGGDFAEIVRSRSTGISAANGGVLGPVGRRDGMFDPLLLEELFRRQQGELTNVVETRLGFAVARVLARQTPESLGKEWLARNRAHLVREKEALAWEKRIKELVRSREVVISDEAREAFRRIDAGKSLPAALLQLPALYVDGVPFILSDLLDPSGLGAPHGADVLEISIRKRVEEFSVARDARNRGVRERYPEIAARESILRENLLSREYFRIRMKGLTVTDAELREYFDAHRSRYVEPEAFDLSFIETKSPDRAAKISSLLSHGVPFGEVADQWSDNREAKGGRIGFVDVDRIVPGLEAVKRLRVGEFTPSPLHLPSSIPGETSLVLARLNAVRGRRELPFDEVPRETLLRSVLVHKREAMARELLAGLRKEHRVEAVPGSRVVAAPQGDADRHGDGM